jgi:hypothetical protein
MEHVFAMSYIRSTSNPEGLYIYGDGDHIIIHHRHGTTHVPPRDFDRVGLRYLKHLGTIGGRPITSGGLTLREVTLYRGTERICPSGHEDRCLARQLKAPKRECRHDYRMLLEYRGVGIFLWKVTWDTIARSIRDHVCLSRGGSKERPG